VLRSYRTYGLYLFRTLTIFRVRLWSAYCGRPSFFMDWDISVDLPDETSSIMDKIGSGIVFLSRRCSETLLSLYSQRHNSQQDELLLVATRIHKALYEWHGKLPAELDWPRRNGDQPPSPGILVMQYASTFSEYAAWDDN
jgi:hypothetical protein